MRVVILKIRMTMEMPAIQWLHCVDPGSWYPLQLNDKGARNVLYQLVCSKIVCVRSRYTLRLQGIKKLLASPRRKGYILWPSPDQGRSPTFSFIMIDFFCFTPKYHFPQSFPFLQNFAKLPPRPNTVGPTAYLSPFIISSQLHRNHCICVIKCRYQSV